jgi:hypothetical protein
VYSALNTTELCRYFVRGSARACDRLKTLPENTQSHDHPLFFLTELDETFRLPSEGREQQKENHCPGRTKDYETRRNATRILLGAIRIETLAARYRELAKYMTLTALRNLPHTVICSNNQTAAACKQTTAALPCQHGFN